MNYIGLLDSTPTTKAHDAHRLDRYMVLDS